MRKVLAQDFFSRRADVVARDLLGKYLVRRKNSSASAFLITETESYDGASDTTSHAARGKTAGNAPMFGEAGRFYVYLCYGMYWMLNVVTGENGYPAAVLIRGVRLQPVRERPSRSEQLGLARVGGKIKGEKGERGIKGPGRLTRELRIDKNFNNKRASKKTGLWFEDRGIIVPPRLIKKTPRIGVGGTEEWQNKPLRFVLKFEARSTKSETSTNEQNPNDKNITF